MYLNLFFTHYQIVLAHFSKVIIQTIVDTNMDFLSNDEVVDNNSTTSTLLIVLAVLLLDEENKTIINSIDTRNFQSLLYHRTLAGTIRRRSFQDPSFLQCFDEFVLLDGQVGGSWDHP